MAQPKVMSISDNWIAIIKQGTPKNRKAFWICRQRKKSVPIDDLYCGAVSGQKCDRTQIDDIYGTKASYPQWGCSECLIQARENPPVTVNLPCHIYCRKHYFCNGTYDPATEKGGFTFWTCGNGRRQRPFSRRKVSEQSRCTAMHDGYTACDVRFRLESMENVWALPTKSSFDLNELARLEWTCKCPDKLHKGELYCTDCLVEMNGPEAECVLRCEVAKTQTKPKA